MKFVNLIGPLLFTALFAQSAWAKEESRCCPSQSIPGVTWERVVSPQAAGWRTQGLADARQYASSIDTTAVMIVQCSRIVDEWGPTDAKLRIASISKSLLSALYGIYEGEGKIPLERTLGDLGIDDLTPLTEQEKQATIRDLVMVRSGIYLPAAAETLDMENARPLRGSHPHGTFWYYNNWDFNALGTIFTVLTGRDVYSAFLERIAEPIGMQDFGIGDYRYWYRRGSAFPQYHANMTARDLARFGLLFLRSGRWRDQQIIPSQWVRESTVTQSSVRSDGLLQADSPTDKGYGYMWWTGRGILPNLKLQEPGFAALGVGGQAVIILPEKDLVIVHLTDDRDPSKQVTTSQIGNIVQMVLSAAPACGN